MQSGPLRRAPAELLVPTYRIGPTIPNRPHLERVMTLRLIREGFTADTCHRRLLVARLASASAANRRNHDHRG